MAVSANRTIILGGTRDLDKEIQDKPGTTAKIDELLPNKWYRCVVRSEKDIVKVFMEKDGKMIEMASSEAFPGGGGVQLDSKSILDLADIEIIEINPVPRVYGEVDKNGRLLGTPPEKAPAPKEKDPILDEK